MLANYSTSVEAAKTVSEIQQILVTHGARSIMTNYDKDGYVESLSFIVPTAYGDIGIRLPVDAQAVLKILERGKVTPKFCNYSQAVRIAWRIAKDWVRAQMALLETEMVKMEQIFLPYMVVKDNKTLYEAMVDRKFYLQEGGKNG